MDLHISKRNEFEVEMDDYKDDLKELEQIDISKWEKRKKDLLQLVKKQKKVIKTGYSEIEEGFNNYHVAISKFITESETDLKSLIKKIKSQTSIAKTKAELHQKQTEQDITNLSKYETAVAEFKIQVRKYTDEVNNLCILTAIIAGYLTERTFKDICDSYEGLLFSKIEKGDVKEYKKFIKKFPKGKYVNQINDEIYNLAIAGSLDYCLLYADMFPNASRL